MEKHEQELNKLFDKRCEQMDIKIIDKTDDMKKIVTIENEAQAEYRKSLETYCNLIHSDFMQMEERTNADKASQMNEVKVVRE